MNPGHDRIGKLHLRRGFCLEGLKDLAVETKLSIAPGAGRDVGPDLIRVSAAQAAVQKVLQQKLNFCTPHGLILSSLSRRACRPRKSQTLAVDSGTASASATSRSDNSSR